MEGIQNQEVTILIAAGILIMLGMALTLIAFYGRAQRKLFAQKLEAQENLLQKTIIAQEEERSRIAKDLHDDIGSKLNVISLYLHRLTKGQDEKTLSVVGEISDILSTSIDTTRRISHELLPPALQKFGLSVALEEMAEGFTNSGQVTMGLSIEGLDEVVPDKMTQLNLFRILQELSKNSTLHGEAKNIQIRFVPTDQGTCFQYKDDGKGADLAQLKTGKGLGMSNIESRLKMIGGTWTIDTSPGNGLKALIEFG